MSAERTADQRRLAQISGSQLSAKPIEVGGGIGIEIERTCMGFGHERLVSRDDTDSDIDPDSVHGRSVAERSWYCPRHAVARPPISCLRNVFL
jgi:hypothetical protein